jgi:flagellar biogenesis protein FliO
MSLRSFYYITIFTTLLCGATPVDAYAEELVATMDHAVNDTTVVSDMERGLAPSMFRMIGGLLLCLGVFAGGIHLVRRFMPQAARTGKRRRLELREKLHISSKMSATLISVDNREFLIATSGDSVTVVPTYSLNTGSFVDSLEDAYRASEVNHG